MTRVGDKFFHENFSPAKSFFRFGNHPLIGAVEFVLVFAAANAASASATGGLEHDRIADLLGQLSGFVETTEIAVTAGGNGDAGFTHGGARLGFVTHAPDNLGGGADKADIAAGADFGQFRVFRKKAIARMQGVTAGGDRQIDQPVSVEITGHGVRPQTVGFIRFFDMQGVAVGFGIDSDRFNAHFRAGADDANGDFPAIGDEDLFYHCRCCRKVAFPCKIK